MRGGARRKGEKGKGLEIKKLEGRGARKRKKINLPETKKDPGGRGGTVVILSGYNCCIQRAGSTLHWVA